MNIIDRYVLKQFVMTVFFAVAALSAIFIVVDLLESLDNFLDQKASLKIIATYYLTYLPSIFTLLIPVGMLLGSLFAVGRLTNTNEIIAIRAAGQSLPRFMLPLLLFGLCMSVFQVWFNGWVTPAANAKKFAIERKYLSRDPGGASLYNMYFRNSPTSNVIIESYDPAAQVATAVGIEEYGSEQHPRLRYRIDAASMKWNAVTKSWIADSAKKTEFRNDSVFMQTLRNHTMPFSISHTQISRLQRAVGELTFTELADYIQTMKRGGKDTRRQEIDAYGQWAFPWGNLIVVLLAVPFASVKRRGGIAVNIAAAMVIAIVYIAFTKISQAFGMGLPLPEYVVAWSANGLFALLGVANLYRMRL